MKSIFIFLISFLIVNFINTSIAQEKFEQRPIEEALNPDGTLRQGVQGSFKVEGYQMLTGANGKPLFMPKTQNTLSGTWEPLGTGAQNGVGGVTLPYVSAFALDGAGRIYVGGLFTQAGGISANYVARFDPATNTWSALGTGVNGTVLALAIDKSGCVYVGGSFTQIGGISASRVACFDPTTNTWKALGISSQNGVGGTSNPRVNAIAIDNRGHIYVGGLFTQAGNVIANRVARFDPSTNTWSSLGTGVQNGVNNTVNAIAIDSSGHVYVGGYFTQAGSVIANRVARFNPITNDWSTLGTGTQNGVNNYVGTIEIDATGNIYVGGGFSQAGGVGANYIARFDPVTNTWSTIGTGVQNGVNNGVNTVAMDGAGRIYVGGAFTKAGGVNTNYVALFDPTTNTWNSLGTGSQNGVSGSGSIYVYDLAIDNAGRVYVGGLFTQAGGMSANNVARWTPSATNVEQIGYEVPSNYLLSQNYPNPFNPSTTISFAIPNSEFVTLKVYDVLGREVATLVNENLNAGSYSYNFDASNLTSGVYFYKLQAGRYSETKKMILSR